jgi:hypothetical protein
LVSFIFSISASPLPRTAAVFVLVMAAVSARTVLALLQGGALITVIFFPISGAAWHGAFVLSMAAVLVRVRTVLAVLNGGALLTGIFFPMSARVRRQGTTSWSWR